MSETLKKIENFKRECLKELYDQLTPEQQTKFVRLYGPLEKIDVNSDNFDLRVGVCERTIAGNQQKSQTTEG